MAQKDDRAPDGGLGRPNQPKDKPDKPQGIKPAGDYQSGDTGGNYQSGGHAGGYDHPEESPRDERAGEDRDTRERGDTKERGRDK
jgi:hypothetical protein